MENLGQPWESCEVVSSYEGGYEIHYAPQINYQLHWRIKFPDGKYEYFRDEHELWQYVLKNKLF